jgi:hypothetical protein
MHDTGLAPFDFRKWSWNWSPMPYGRVASSIGYRLIAKTVNTLVYEDAQSDQYQLTVSEFSRELL